MSQLGLPVQERERGREREREREREGRKRGRECRCVVPYSTVPLFHIQATASFPLRNESYSHQSVHRSSTTPHQARIYRTSLRVDSIESANNRLCSLTHLSTLPNAAWRFRKDSLKL